LEPYPKNIQNRIKTISKSYQNQIKTQKPAKNRPKTCPSALSVSFFEANSLEPHQNRIKIISKSYQNPIKTISKYTETITALENSTKNLSLGCFCFFV
jgi:DNA-binding ferritin-like protein (Dps family)